MRPPAKPPVPRAMQPPRTTTRPLPPPTVPTVAVRLGGEFKTLSESEERYKGMLAGANSLVQAAEEALGKERHRTSSLTQALYVMGTSAAEAEVATEAAQALISELGSQATDAAVKAAAFKAELEAIEGENTRMKEDANAREELLRSTTAALWDERARTASLAAALEARDAENEAGLRREAELRKELDEERQRARRFALARTEKEKQLAVVLSEKNRLSALLSKKDTLARDLTSALKTQERHELLNKQSQQKQMEQRRLVRAQAAIAIGEAAATKALGEHEEHGAGSQECGDTTTIGEAAARASAVLTGVAKESIAGGAAAALARDVAMKLATASPLPNDVLRMPKRVPGVQSRFDASWRSASAPQREAALKSENAVLIGVLAERDAALLKAEAEMRKLKAEHHAMQTRWREANKVLQQRRAASASATATVGRAAVSALVSAFSDAADLPISSVDAEHRDQLAAPASPSAALPTTTASSDGSTASPPAPAVAQPDAPQQTTPPPPGHDGTTSSTSAACKAAAKASFLHAMEQAAAAKQPPMHPKLAARLESAPAPSPRTPAGAADSSRPTVLRESPA